MVGPAVNGYAAAALLDDAVTGGQPKARPLPLGLGGEKRLEKMRLVLFRNSDAGIAHRNADVLSRTCCRRDVDGPCINPLDPDGDLAAVRHGVARIDQQVDDDLFDLSRISPDESRAARRGFQFDVFPNEALQHALQIGHEGADIEYLRLQRLLAAVGQQLVGEGRRPVGRGQYALGVLGGGMLLVDQFADEVPVDHDRGQNIVEVVRDPPREPSDRLHLH